MLKLMKLYVLISSDETSSRRILDELHDTHPGCSKMKALARSYIWWPRMDADIEDTVKSCTTCQENRPSPSSDPWELPAQPWSRLHLDFAAPYMGHMFLVLMDAHSKWLDVHKMSNISSSRTIERLRMMFATHGLPQKIVTDNGPSFTSDEFKRFQGKIHSHDKRRISLQCLLYFNSSFCL